MVYESKREAMDISILLKGIEEEMFNDSKKIFELCEKSLIEDGFKIENYMQKEYEPQGYSLNFLLSESHLELSTYPEYGTLVAHLSSCNIKKDGTAICKNLVDYFSPKTQSIEKKIFKLD